MMRLFRSSGSAEANPAQTETQIDPPQATTSDIEKPPAKDHSSNTEDQAGDDTTVDDSRPEAEKELPSNEDEAKDSQTEQNASGATKTEDTTKAEGEKGDTTTAIKDTATSDNADDTSKYPGGTKLALLTFGLAMATFVIALDNTIIATAIPRITSDFNALNDVGWYGSSYLLTTTSLQPSFGKVYAYFDVKWVYLSALMIFEGV